MDTHCHYLKLPRVPMFPPWEGAIYLPNLYNPRVLPTNTINIIQKKERTENVQNLTREHARVGGGISTPSLSQIREPYIHCKRHLRLI